MFLLKFIVDTFIIIKFKMFGGGFPFDFAGMGGGPQRPKKDVDNKKFYEILGVAKNATTDEIKKAFKKKALIMHPDKGGDIEKF